MTAFGRAVAQALRPLLRNVASAGKTVRITIGRNLDKVIRGRRALGAKRPDQSGGLERDRRQTIALGAGGPTLHGQEPGMQLLAVAGVATMPMGRHGQNLIGQQTPLQAKMLPRRSCTVVDLPSSDRTKKVQNLRLRSPAALLSHPFHRRSRALKISQSPSMRMPVLLFFERVVQVQRQVTDLTRRQFAHQGRSGSWAVRLSSWVLWKI